MIKLKNEAECLIAQQIAALRRQIVDALVVKEDFAFIGPVEDAKQVQQRTLARTGGADDAQEFALLDLQIEAAQHLRFNGVLAVGLLQSERRQDRHGFLHGSHLPSCDYSYRSARTGCSSAARSAGKMLNSTAMLTAPMLINTTVNGCKSVGMSFEIVNVAREYLLPGKQRQAVFDRVNVDGYRHAENCADAGANHSKQQAVTEEDFEDAPLRSAERFENTNIARLFDHDHRKNGKDAEARHADDHKEQHVEDAAFHGDGGQQRPLQILPGIDLNARRRSAAADAPSRTSRLYRNP